MSDILKNIQKINIYFLIKKNTCIGNFIWYQYVKYNWYHRKAIISRLNFVTSE